MTVLAPGAAALLLDFNGTLSDDEPVLAEIYVELGAVRTVEEYFERFLGASDVEILAREAVRWAAARAPSRLRV